MLYIDTKYIGLITSRLDRLKRKGNSYNFRCPICGDSHTNRSKARGYIYQRGDEMLFYCHNCHASMRFGNFLKFLDPELHKEYVQERFVEKHNPIPVPEHDITKIVKPRYLIDSPLKDLRKISQLDWDHPAKRYVQNRLIPTRQHAKLFYVPRFKKWVNKFIPDKFDLENSEDEPRLIIPFIDETGYCYGVQGRSFKKDGIRYITIIFDDERPKVFGLDTVDYDKPIYVTEGPIDSMFLPNAIAMAGSDSVNVIDSMDIDKGKITFVYDNEPRNKEIVRIMEKVIDKGYNVCFWPEHIVQKDINDMILNGLKQEDVKLIIDNNTYKELQAKMKMVTWRKV